MHEQKYLKSSVMSHDQGHIFHGLHQPHSLASNYLQSADNHRLTYFLQVFKINNRILALIEVR